MFLFLETLYSCNRSLLGNHYQTETWIINEACILLHLCYTHSMYARMFDFVNQSMFNRHSWKLCAKLVINVNLCMERILNENDT